MPASAPLAVNALTVRDGAKVACESISFALEAGECFVAVGPA